jgi:hypothetical protein
MYTIVDINNTFEAIAAEHLELKSFDTGGLDRMDVDKLDVNKFPLLYAQCTSADLDSGVTVLTYEVMVADLVIEKQEKFLTQVYSETFLILNDVAAKFYFAVYDGNRIVDRNLGFNLPIVCDPFTARFDNLLTGWSASFEIRLPNAINLCDAPF